MTALGFVVRPEHPPEALPGLAQAVEDAGFDELWLWEDCFLAGGIAITATARGLGDTADMDALIAQDVDPRALAELLPLGGAA